MKPLVGSAVFVSSRTKLADCPLPAYPEYAFIGRSNVGKSSLINALTCQKGLAKVSSTPGKTQTINHFLVDNAWYLVDLPGYGYAKAPQSKAETWSKFVNDYLLGRKNLVHIFVLIDSRLPLQKNDLAFILHLAGNNLSFSLVFTKIDKLSNLAWHKNKQQFVQSLTPYWHELPSFFATSSEKKTGMRELLDYILQQNQVYKQFFS